MNTHDVLSEKDPIKQQHVLSFIGSCDRPRTVMNDYGMARYYYSKYIVEHAISKPYFLYIWLCFRDSKSTIINMGNYEFFNDETVKPSKMSYRDFTQMYVDPIIVPNVYNIHYECILGSYIYHNYPISLRSVMDRFELRDSGDYCTLSEGNTLLIKTIPKIMAPPDDVYKRDTLHDTDTLMIKYRGSVARCDTRYSIVESTDETAHTELLDVIYRLVDATLPIECAVSKHIFSFPSREINYKQIAAWLTNGRVPHSRMENAQHISTADFIPGAQCEIVNRVLDCHKCYDNSRYEIYRLKSDKVLEISVSSIKTRAEIESSILQMCQTLSKEIHEDFPDPMSIDSTNIAKLRATNSIVFDGMYCRKAPPQVQPLVIRQSEIESVLASDRMILIYNGLYYTTMPKSQSKGNNYIGIINRFGDYNPSKPYIPIIRTYKKNHLQSTTFKELKAYLLRHSQDPTRGNISPLDILLPPSMQYLYKVPLMNPPLDIVNIHTKKTSITDINKVASGEVPDYMKSVLGVSHVRRIVLASRGTGLLDVCKVDPIVLHRYIAENLDSLQDLASMSMDTITKQVKDGMLDHRLYGKAIESLIDKCLIVFDITGVVPYRCSKYESENYVLLFLSASGMYDELQVAAKLGELFENVRALRDVINDKHMDVSGYMKRMPSRDVDYTLIMLRLVSYITRHARENAATIEYKIIPESECKYYVEKIYTRTIYYEGITKCSNARFLEKLVRVRKSNCSCDVNLQWICSVLRDMIPVETFAGLVVISPVDMSLYHPWNFNLEQCLYYSHKCYIVRDNEEVQRIML